MPTDARAILLHPYPCIKSCGEQYPWLTPLLLLTQSLAQLSSQPMGNFSESSQIVAAHGPRDQWVPSGWYPGFRGGLDLALPSSFSPASRSISTSRDVAQDRKRRSRRPFRAHIPSGCLYNRVQGENRYPKIFPNDGVLSLVFY